MGRIKKFYQGEIVWIDFDPVLGSEQGKRRPAVVVSVDDYNAVSRILIVCPITSQSKGYPFEVPVETKKISGYMLADHIRSLDTSERNVSHSGMKLSSRELKRALHYVALLCGMKMEG